MTTRTAPSVRLVLALFIGAGAVCVGAPAHAAGALPSDPQRDLAAAVAARLDSLDAPRLDAVYGADPAPLWIRDGHLTPRGRMAWAELQGARQRGLPPARYGLDDLTRLREREAPEAHALAALETGMSRALLRLTQDVAHGVLTSAGFDHGWALESRDTVAGFAPDSVPASPAGLLSELDRVSPTGGQYHRLLPLLQRLRALRDSGGWREVRPVDGVVEVGDSAPVVVDVRARMRQSLSARERRLARRGSISARYDSALARGVEHFQERHGIAVDGVLGPETQRELNTTVERRIDAVRVALERWRWLPAKLGSTELPGAPAVLVNTAGRRVHVVEGDTAVLSMKVIVGQRDWKTTLFEDALERMVVNPYWNVPESIMKEETLPKAAGDPGYLERNDFQVLDADGQVVPLEAIDWRTVEPDSFPHRIRQLPGDANALGRVKFLFPNRFAIYLHDTPADQLFDERIRTFSHGCIRVERPAELAHYLLRTATDVAPTRFGELKATRERHVVELDETIPTYVVYQTVWVDADGLPTFTPDIYGRDGRVRDALAALDEKSASGPETTGAGEAP
jgi:murein L,D-transpeptidase YcbB/YkuD